MVKRILKFFQYKFPNPAMESEYSSIKALAIPRDFLLSTFYMFVMNVLLLVPALVNVDIPNILISSITITILLVVVLVRRWFGTKLQYLTIFALFSYILGRILLIKSNYSTASKASIFFQGYGFAAIQFIIISRFNKFTYQISAAFILLVLRVTIIYAYIDPSAFRGLSLVRQIVIDLFMVVMFYSTERSNRSIFKNFYENREELVKFKELLADSLPQGVTIINLRSLRPLFTNNTFRSTFENLREGQDNQLTETSQTANTFLTNMMIDPTTVREIGIIHSEFQAIDIFDGVLSLEQVVKLIVEKELLSDKAISVSAFHGKHDKRRSFEITLKRVKWDAEDAIAIILNDITYQQNLIALKVSNQNKDKILATVSHELRTPLHGIINLIEISEKKLHNDEAIENLSLCKNNAILLLSLVNSILDLHQLSMSKLELHPKKFDLRKSLSSVLRLFHFQCNQKGLYLKLQVAEGVPTHIVTDSDRLNEILINLIGNAFKFTFKGGIKIEIGPDLENPNRITIGVIDTGIGIKESDQNHLFKFGGKLEDEASVNKHGVGLGLTISNSLVIKLNGKEEDEGIKLISNYKQGSKFYFSILKDLNHALQNEKSNVNTKLDDVIGKSDDKYDHIYRMPSQASEKDDFAKESGESPPEISFQEVTEVSNIALKLRSYTLARGTSSQELKPLAKERSISPYNHIANKDGVLVLPATPAQNQEGTLNIFDIDYDKANHSPNSYILVVDDNPFNILIAEKLLKHVGFGIKSVFGGSEAIEAVQESSSRGENIKLILMDCQMPLMDGYETTRRLQNLMQKNGIPKIPIVAWTANNSKEDIQRCYDSGMIGFLSKPTSQEALINTLSDLGLGR